MIQGRIKAIFFLVWRFLVLGGVLYPKRRKSPQTGKFCLMRVYQNIGTEKGGSR